MTKTVLRVLAGVSALSVIVGLLFGASPAHATTYEYTGNPLTGCRGIECGFTFAGINAFVTIDAGPDATGTFSPTFASINNIQIVPIVPFDGNHPLAGASVTLDNGLVQAWDLFFSVIVLGSATSVSIQTTSSEDSFDQTSDSGVQTASNQDDPGVWTCTDCGPPSTPLPSALPLFATGLGALGLLGWHRKRKAQAVAA